MSLKPCKECGHKVSTKADKCHNCGAPVAQKSGCFGVLVLLVLGMFLILVFAQGEKNQKKNGTISSPQEIAQSQLPKTTPSGKPIQKEPEKENPKSPALIPSHELVNEELYDAPVKTQVVQHIAVSGDVTDENLKELLMQQYDLIMKRSGFKYHEKPTNIFVYLYENKEKAEAQQGLWLAMLEMVVFLDGKPKVTVRSEQLNRLGKSPKEKFGLSESIRQEISREIFQSDHKAMAEAEEKEPSNLQNQSELSSRLMEKYKMQLAEKYNLTREQLDSIGLEGITSLWITEKQTRAAKTITHNKGIGLSYAEVMSHLSDFFSMKETTPVNGQTRFLGQSADSLAILEIIGNPANISQASLSVGMPNDAPAIVNRNSALILLFLKNVAPSWPGREQWAIESVQKIAEKPSTSTEIILGNKAIQMKFYRSLGMFMVTVSHALNNVVSTSHSKEEYQDW